MKRGRLRYQSKTMKEGMVIKEPLPDPKREGLIEQFLNFETPRYSEHQGSMLGSQEVFMLGEPYLAFYETDSDSEAIEDMKTRWLRHEASNADLVQLAEAFADFVLAQKGKVIHGRFQGIVRQPEKEDELPLAA